MQNKYSNVAATPTPRVPQVPLAVQRLEGILSLTQDTVKILTERLAPVMAYIVPVDESKREVEEMSPLASSLENIRDGFVEVNRQLQKLVDILDI